MANTLRPYQSELIARARDEFKSGNKSCIIQLSTGGGKTMLTASMIKGSLDKKMTALFIVHRKELVIQSASAFDQHDIPYGIIASGFTENYQAPVQIASIQTLRTRLHRLRYQPNLVVFDECHHQAAKNWAGIFKHFSAAYKIGLTATPCRLDQKGLREFYSQIIQGPPMRWLIDQGFLADYKLYAPSSVNLAGVHTRMGDYVKSELAELMDTPKFTGDAIREYSKLCLGKRAVVFCVNVEHSKHVSSEFNQAGIKAEHIDGASDLSYRTDALARFKTGETKVLCNVELFGEGFDLPDIECAILLRPTKSTSLYLQQVGRALRPTPGKSHAIIIDHVRNCEQHGLPDDDREWSLDGMVRSKTSELAVKICSSCFAAVRPTVRQCPYCQHIFQVKGKEFDILNASTKDELVEVDKSKLRKSNFDVERSRAQSKDELIQLAVSRNYKFPHRWAMYIWQARQRKKLGR